MIVCIVWVLRLDSAKLGKCFFELRDQATNLRAPLPIAFSENAYHKERYCQQCDRTEYVAVLLRPHGHDS